jgi:galactokinase
MLCVTMSADIDRLRASFATRYERAPRTVAEAPGRVNLIGEHTDYNQGHVLPVAIDRTLAVAVSPSDDGVVRAYAVDFDETDEFPTSAPRRTKSGDWRNYVRGLVWAFLRAGIPLPGADIAFTGDIPMGAGLSSSAALEVAVAAALSAAGGTSLEHRQIALIAHRAENRFVGVRCGVMDQLITSLGRKGHALLIDCKSLETADIPLNLADRGIAIVIIDSGVRRSLSDTPYNQRRRECAEAARALGVRALRDVDETNLDSRFDALPDTLRRRARHVVTEEGRVLAAVEALRRPDPISFAHLLYDSHQSLREDFEVSCPELDILVELAAQVGGVMGARLTGAGFGGCTVNLVRAVALEEFRDAITQQYAERHGGKATIHRVHSTDGLRVFDV